MNKEQPFWKWKYNQVSISELKPNDRFCFYDNNCPEFFMRKLENNKVYYASINRPDYIMSCDIKFYQNVYQIDSSSRYIN